MPCRFFQFAEECVDYFRAVSSSKINQFVISAIPTTHVILSNYKLASITCLFLALVSDITIPE